MIDWIKFSEKVPDGEGLYLCYFYKARLPYVLYWTGTQFYTIGYEKYRQSVMDCPPDYWTEINLPEGDPDA